MLPKAQLPQGADVSLTQEVLPNQLENKRPRQVGNPERPHRPTKEGKGCPEVGYGCQGNYRFLHLGKAQNYNST